MQILKITFLNDINIEHTLQYSLLDTDLTSRWIDIVSNKLQDPSHSLHSMFSNKSYSDVVKITETINKTVESINVEYDIELPVYDILGTTELNYLHNEYENFGKRYRADNRQFSKLLHNNFLFLNETIHVCEHALTSKPSGHKVTGAIFDIHPNDTYQLFLEEDKLLLRPDMLWGKIYLGYATLGKDWLQTIRYRDHDLINKNNVVPQRRFSAELWINFGLDYEAGYWQTEFYKRVKALPKELQVKVPLHDLNELTLGRFIIGDLIIDDNMLSFDTVESNWKTPNHPVKQAWNTKVFSTFRKVSKIEFI